MQRLWVLQRCRMDGSYAKTVREVEEECGLLRSGVRFRQEKRQQTEESPSATKIINYKIKQGTKRPYKNEEEDQATPESEDEPT